METAALLGAELRALRDKQERTLEEVAAAAKVSRSALSRIELGQQACTTDQLMAICGALGVSPARLIGRLEREAAPA